MVPYRIEFSCSSGVAAFFFSLMLRLCSETADGLKALFSTDEPFASSRTNRRPSLATGRSKSNVFRLLVSGKRQRRLTVVRPKQGDEAIWVHPGEPVFERFRATVSDELGDEALRGAVFVDPTSDRPYLFHLALTNVLRQADPELPELANEEPLECRLVGVKQYEGAEVDLCPVEHLLLLKGGQGIPGSAAQRLAVSAGRLKEQAEAFVTERVARGMASERRTQLLETLPERERFTQRGFDYQEAELATARVKLSEKARSGNSAAVKALKDIKDQQRSLAERRRMSLASLRREPKLIAPGQVTFLAHALIVPSTDPEDRKRHDAEVERVAMDLARVFEEAAGATVQDVSRPPLARAAGLTDNPGFDLLAIYKNGERRAIEVKGRASTGDVEVSSNEWASRVVRRGVLGRHAPVAYGDRGRGHRRGALQAKDRRPAAIGCGARPRRREAIGTKPAPDLHKNGFSRRAQGGGVSRHYRVLCVRAPPYYPPGARDHRSHASRVSAQRAHTQAKGLQDHATNGRAPWNCGAALGVLTRVSCTQQEIHG